MILKIIVVLLLLYLTVAIVINGLLMFVSPRAWFRLPRGLKASGSLSAGRYSSGWGAIEVRLAGAAVLGLMVYMFRRIFAGSHEEMLPLKILQKQNTLRWIAPVFMWILILGLAINGLFMLISPNTWFRLPWWIRGRPGFAEKVLAHGWGIVFLRCAGAVLVSAAVLFAYAYCPRASL
jgi:uncharacterized protein YjeT (DUF2065 family)